MATVLLHIRKTTRRKALAHVISSEYDVLFRGDPAAQDQQEDLLVLDNPTLQRSGHEALTRYKNQDPRPEAPILLILPTPRSAALEAEVWARVDDVVETPVRWPEMRGRIQVLIQMQALAREKKSVQNLVSRYSDMLEEEQGQTAGYKNLFESSACGRLVLRGQEIIEANLRAKQLLGTEDLIGQSVGALSPPEQPGGVSSGRGIQDLLRVRNGETKQAEWTFVHPEDGPSPFRLVLSPLRFRGEDCAQVLFLNGCADG
jgi:PAS domain-containing protein